MGNRNKKLAGEEGKKEKQCSATTKSPRTQLSPDKMLSAPGAVCLYVLVEVMIGSVIFLGSPSFIWRSLGKVQNLISFSKCG